MLQVSSLEQAAQLQLSPEFGRISPKIPHRVYEILMPGQGCVCVTAAAVPLGPAPLGRMYVPEQPG